VVGVFWVVWVRGWGGVGVVIVVCRGVGGGFLSDFLFVLCFLFDLVFMLPVFLGLGGEGLVVWSGEVRWWVGWVWRV